jgi:hypothetical protein
LETSYKNWCKENGADTINQRTFSKRIQEHGIIDFKGTAGKRFWKGLRLLTSDEKNKDSGKSFEPKVATLLESSQTFPYEGNKLKVYGNTLTLATLDTNNDASHATSGNKNGPKTAPKTAEYFYYFNDMSNTVIDDGLEPPERMSMLVDGCAMFTPQIIEVWIAGGKPQILCSDGVIKDLKAYLDAGVKNLDHVGAIVDAIRGIKNDDDN